MSPALEKAHQRREELRDSGDLAGLSDAFQRFAKKNTRRTAIDAFCRHCTCPLWNWRPYK